MSLLTNPRYGKRKKMLVIGAGEAGRLICDNAIGKEDLHYEIVGMVDDDESKKGQEYKGIPITGPIRNLQEIKEKLNPDEVIIAMPSQEGNRIKEIAKECMRLKLEIKILPSYFEEREWMKKGISGYGEVRPLLIQDFFRRKPLASTINQVEEMLQNKTVLVTGASGSIGSELCHQLIRFGINKLIALDHSESDLHDLHLEIGDKEGRFIPVLGSVRDKKKLENVMKAHEPSIVFHAAAYKHVPEMEYNPDEAVKNNVIGTRNLIEVSEDFDIEQFVLVSTDKAVNPTSIMGATKRITEMMIQELPKRDKTKFVAVRFGNVLNSRGSVIPLFDKQIKRGGPLTVTHRDVKRYFMAIPEAVYLIIQSLLLGKNGDLFVLDMGEQVKLSEVANEMIRIAGFEPEKDIKIEYIGLRPGEKMYEDLYGNQENQKETENERIKLVITNKNNHANFEAKLDELTKNAEEGKFEDIKANIIELIPENEIKNG